MVLYFFSQFLKVTEGMEQIHFIFTYIQMICLWRPFYYKDFSFSVSLGGLTCFLRVQGISFFLSFFQGISEHPTGDSLQCWFTNWTGKDNNILALNCPLFSFFHCLWLFGSWIALRIKNPTCNDCRRHGGHEFDPWVRKIPSTPVFSPKKIPWTEEPGRL